MPRLRHLMPLALVGYLLTGVAQVGPADRAVVRRFGRVVARPGPGLWVGLPWGVDRVDRVPVRAARQVAVGYAPADPDESPAAPPGQLPTGDRNLVNVRLVVEYAVDDSDAGVDAYLAHRDRVDGALAREAEAAAAEWAAGRPVDDVLLTGRAALPRWVADRLAGRLPALGLGVLVQRVSVDHLAPPEEVRAAFDEVTQAQTGVQTRENEARRERDRRLQEAAATALQLGRQAEAYRREKLALARADAEAFAGRLAQYKKLRETNPDVLAGIWWDEMGRTLLGMKGRGRVDVLDHHLGPAGLDVTQFLPPRKN